ncbi:TolC family outer membrane protein [Aliiroseovarius sp. YM-037]|uniref:TolC family outer membrane protein n=1 Tax=Aliiroseovarius sp. YM-037 TaxID=3341728 RepID=UPI003A80B3C1
MKASKIRAGIRSLIVAGAMGLSAVSAHAETLTDALISAYQESGLLDQNRALLRAADEDVAQAVATLRPVIGWTARATYSHDPVNLSGDHLTQSLGLSADLTVYDFGRNRLAIEAAKETVLATREALVGIEQQVLLRAVEAFMNVRREAEFVSLRNNNVRLITQELRAAQDRFEVGEVTRTDVSIAEARLASARAGLAAAEGALAQAREEYKAAIGRYPGQLASPPTPPQTARSMSAAQGIAVQNHPDVRQAQREVTVAELNIRRAEANFLPNATLNGQTTVDQDGDANATLSLNLGGPIYQGGQLKSLRRQSIARRDASRAALHLATLSVAQNVGNAWSSLIVARASIEATDRQVRASRVAYRGVREEATLGARTTLDVLDAEQELLDAQANRISAGVDAQIASYRLLAAMGHLTVRHLNLGIATYDPADYYNAVRNAPTRPISEQGQRLDGVLERLNRN